VDCSVWNYVVEESGRWWVRHSGASYPYHSRAIAVDAAIDAANTSGKRGYDARVMVPGPEDEWELAWVYGRDSYPVDLPPA
jgi:hypothetical protein